jgi:hypothetical protein
VATRSGPAEFSQSAGAVRFTCRRNVDTSDQITDIAAKARNIEL